MLWRGYGETDFALRSLAVMGSLAGLAEPKRYQGC